MQPYLHERDSATFKSDLYQRIVEGPLFGGKVGVAACCELDYTLTYARPA
jgi:hypothetical protein